MGLFDIFRKKEEPKHKQPNKILLAMPLFINGDRYELSSIIDNLKNFWGLDVVNDNGNNDTAILTVDGSMVAIAFMPVKVPEGDITGTSQYAYNWPAALDDLKEHSGHAIVSVMQSKKSAIDRFALLSKLLYSILKTSNAVGVYQGSQTLLIPKDQYLNSAEELKNNQIPINLWVYIGLRKTASGNCVYTYGLTEFGKQEMEVLNSSLGLEELYDFIANICVYVIGSNVTFKSGETLGYTAEQKIKISSSKGHLVEGESLKLEM